MKNIQKRDWNVLNQSRFQICCSEQIGKRYLILRRFWAKSKFWKNLNFRKKSKISKTFKIFKLTQNRRKMRYGDVWGCKMGLRGSKNPKILFSGRSRPNFRPNRPWYMIAIMADSAGNSAGIGRKNIFWILWTQKTHFAPSNVSISHFAVILSQFENSVIFRYSKIYKKSSEISVALCCPKSKNFQDADSKILWGVTGMFWEACALFVDFRNRFLAISRDPSTSGSKMLHF